MRIRNPEKYNEYDAYFSALYYKASTLNLTNPTNPKPKSLILKP